MITLDIQLGGSTAKVNIKESSMNIDRSTTLEDVCTAQDITVTRENPQKGLDNGRYLLFEFNHELQENEQTVLSLNELFMSTDHSRYLPEEYAAENMKRYYVKLYSDDKVDIN